MGELSSGTVTSLLTDVEGSTALWEEDLEATRIGVPGLPLADRVSYS